MFVVCGLVGAPAVVAVLEVVEEQAVAGGTVQRVRRQPAMRRIMVGGGRHCGNTTEVVGTDMASENTNDGERTENSVQDLRGGLSACLWACLFVGLWASVA